MWLTNSIWSSWSHSLERLSLLSSWVLPDFSYFTGSSSSPWGGLLCVRVSSSLPVTCSTWTSISISACLMIRQKSLQSPITTSVLFYLIFNLSGNLITLHCKQIQNHSSLPPLLPRLAILPLSLGLIIHVGSSLPLASILVPGSGCQHSGQSDSLKM